MKELEKILMDNMPETIKELQKCISFNTVQIEPCEGMPFGKPTADCLDYMLKLGEKLGFKSENFDNYAGHIEWGEGDEVLGILGHLDVVPVSEDGWIAPPFSGEIVNGRIYGRGAIDDKGPVLSCLYAMKTLKDAGFEPKRKIRLIMGCNEETGMLCMKHYLSKVKPPEISFTPDGNFPCIYGEKGIYGMDIFLGKLPKQILSLTAGERVNVVPDSCKAIVSDDVDLTAIMAEKDITIAKTQEGNVITAVGVSCHGSMPESGKNAVWAMMKALKKVFPNSEEIAFIADKLCRDYNGGVWGLPLEDAQSGKMTFSLNVLRLTEEGLNGKIDFRFPVSYTHEYLENCIKENSPQWVKIIGGHKSPSVYVSRDSELVKVAEWAFEEVMGEKQESMVIGGGTYAKALNNCVAIGPEFQGDEQTMHQTNEYLSLERLNQMSKIYLRVIKKLAE